MRITNEVFGLLDTDKDCFRETDALNTDEKYINFRNGILDLDTMKMLPHSPEILSTIQIPCDYNPNVTKPKDSHFENYLMHLCENDSKRVNLVLEMMGVALSNVPAYKAKKAFFMVGEGNTGKSQAKELIARMIGGEYVSSVDLGTLENRFGTSLIYGKRLAGSSDMGYMKIEELKLFKQITGGDTIAAEFKGENGFSFKYKGLLWFCCNDMPKFGGDKGDHVYDRMIILECNNYVEKKDPDLLDKMYAEREYIAYLCVLSLKRFIERGCKYTEPDCTVQAVERYKTVNDSPLSFIEECTEPKNGRYVYTTKDVHDAYKQWCRETGEYTVKLSEFKRSLDRGRKGETTFTKGIRYYSQFQLNDEGKRMLSAVSKEPCY